LNNYLVWPSGLNIEKKCKNRPSISKVFKTKQAEGVSIQRATHRKQFRKSDRILPAWKSDISKERHIERATNFKRAP